MKPIIELAKFADGDLMVRVRFRRNSNFWFNGEETTWVPTLDEADLIKEGVYIVDKRNEEKRKERQEVRLSNIVVEP